MLTRIVIGWRCREVLNSVFVCVPDYSHMYKYGNVVSVSKFWLTKVANDRGEKKRIDCEEERAMVIWPGSNAWM